MIRPILAAALALALAGCGKAPPDVTARYALAGGAGTITVKAAANGDARVDSPGQTLIRKGGAEYLVLADPQGRYAARVPDFIAVMGAMARERGLRPTGIGAQPAYTLVKTGSETVAGQPGEVWQVRPPGTPAPAAIEAVLSTDPALAKAGSALAMQTRLGAAGVAQMQGGQGALEKKVAELLDKGMVLRFATALTLTRVEKAPISGDAFDLPATVVDAATLRKRLEALRPPAPAAAPPAPR